MTDEPGPTHVHGTLLEDKKSSFQKYRELVIGEEGILYLFRYELCTTLFTNLPGGFGYALRKLFFPSLLNESGRGTIFGRDITIRHPRKIRLGDRVNLGEFTTLDAFG